MRILTRKQQLDIIEHAALLYAGNMQSYDEDADPETRERYNIRMKALNGAAENIARRVMGEEGVELLQRRQRMEALRIFNHLPTAWAEYEEKFIDEHSKQ